MSTTSSGVNAEFYPSSSIIRWADSAASHREGRLQGNLPEFAVAIERTTGVIETGDQEALELAQQTIDAPRFCARTELVAQAEQSFGP